jgi:hypothetical protein
MDPSQDAATDAPPATPALAGRRRRLFAWLIDYLIVMAPGLALVAFAVASLAQSLPGFVGAVAAEAGWSRVVRLFTHRAGAGLGDNAAQEWLLFAAPLLVALLAVPLLQFLYLTGMLGWRGRTLGMVAADVRAVRSVDFARLRRGRAMRRAAATTVVETGLVGAALALMVIGFMTIGLVLWGAAIVFFWLNVMVALGPRRRSLVDRLSGVQLVRGGLYAAVGRTAAVAGRRGSQAALTAGRTVADAAAATGDLARQVARRLHDSRTAAQAIGAAAAPVRPDSAETNVEA